MALTREDREEARAEAISGRAEEIKGDVAKVRNIVLDKVLEDGTYLADKIADILLSSAADEPALVRELIGRYAAHLDESATDLARDEIERQDRADEMDHGETIFEDRQYHR